MLIRDATREQIERALASANLYFAGNIKFKRVDHAGGTMRGGEKWTVTLGVNDSAQAGSRRSQSGRRIAAACWHAHGFFMDALPEGSTFVTNGPAGRAIKKPGDKWQDCYLNSPYSTNPFKHSMACECEKNKRSE